MNVLVSWFKCAYSFLHGVYCIIFRIDKPLRMFHGFRVFRPRKIQVCRFKGYVLQTNKNRNPFQLICIRENSCPTLLSGRPHICENLMLHQKWQDFCYFYISSFVSSFLSTCSPWIYVFNKVIARIWIGFKKFYWTSPSFLFSVPPPFPSSTIILGPYFLSIYIIYSLLFEFFCILILNWSVLFIAIINYLFFCSKWKLAANQSYYWSLLIDS